MRSELNAISLIAVLVPVSTAQATDYLSIADAQKLMFPEAGSFTPHTVSLNDTQQQAIARLSGLPLRGPRWQVLQAHQGNETLGYLVIDNVIGKFESITYAVALGKDGSVRQVEILSYRESHGQEVRLPAWRQQFVGKSIKSPLKIGSDIANISGATLSCTHLTDGVRRIVSVVRTALDSHLL